MVTIRVEGKGCTRHTYLLSKLLKLSQSTPQLCEARSVNLLIYIFFFCLLHEVTSEHRCHFGATSTVSARDTHYRQYVTTSTAHVSSV